MAGRTNHRTTKTCHRACLFAYADFADTKKLNLLRQRKRNDRIEKLSQTIDRQEERPVGNRRYILLPSQWVFKRFSI